MSRRHKPSTSKWARSVGSALALLIFHCLSSSAAGLSIQRYVMPTYPAMANRSRIQATFFVELDLIAGRVKAVRIVRSEIIGMGDKKVQGLAPPDFEVSIRDSLSRWEFNSADMKDMRTISLTVEFRLAKTTSTGDNARYTFQVEEKQNLPWRLTIEASRLGADLEFKREPIE